MHHKNGKWAYQTFKGTKWQSIKDDSRRLYLKNAYRVILRRARQGMIVFVPKGNTSDHTTPLILRWHIRLSSLVRHHYARLMVGNG
nr:DNA/RNA helicase domain-containing protein [Acidisarcina polymorpha]